jgi:hypothetical protein
MKGTIAVTVFALMCASAFAGDTGPLPQTGKDHPEVTKGAKESGAMDTKGAATNKGTTGMSQGANAPNGSPNAPPKATQGPQGDPSKANDTPK